MLQFWVTTPATRSTLEQGRREPNTLRALELGLANDGWPKLKADRFIQHYRALRRIEGILRRWSFAGETVLPDELAPLRRVAVRAGFESGEELLAAVARDRAAIRAGDESVLRSNQVGRGSSKTSRTLRAREATEYGLGKKKMPEFKKPA